MDGARGDEGAGDGGAGMQYVLGHSAHELERLVAQARFFEPLTAQFFHAAGITTGMRVPDVGCGAGDVSFLVARMVGPTGQVVGVDRSALAVATASRRAVRHDLPTIRFVEGDASELANEEPFDGAVGRWVLMFAHEPAALVRQVVERVRCGGVIAFQEADWTGGRSWPESPTWTNCMRWGAEAFRQSGADPYMGLKLHAVFTAAGLPSPSLWLSAGIGAGPGHPLYAIVAETIRTLLPAIERLGLATADEVGIDTLARRIEEEMVGSQGTVTWGSLVGAAARKPEER